MSRINFILAWKDEDYRERLTEEERAKLPENPVGFIELIPDEGTFRGAAVLKVGGFEPVQFSIWSFLSNCKNISEAMSSTSTCCCYSIPDSYNNC